MPDAGVDLLVIDQGAAADAEAKSEELSRAVEELHKLLKEAGEGESLTVLPLSQRF